MPINGGEYQSVPANSTPEAQLFARGREVLGRNAGGMIAKLKRFRQGNVALARATLEVASTKHNPREYIGRVLAGQITDGDTPEVVRHGRRDGLYVERLAPNRWKVGTWIYDERGREVGF